MATLGEQLKAREARDKADKQYKLEREAREAGEKAMQALRDVKHYFEQAKDNIIADISADRPVREITLGKQGDPSRNVASILATYNWTSGRQGRPGGIEDASHPYYAVWEAFRNWADSEGLDVHFSYQHDGVGMWSWQELVVKAKIST